VILRPSASASRTTVLIVGWLPALAWAGVLFAGSSTATPALGWLAGLFEGADKLIHFGLYVILGGLLCRALLYTGSAKRRRLWIALGALLGAAYGASDEFHQSFVTGRYSEYLDLLADSLGSLSGALAWGWLAGRSGRNGLDCVPPADRGESAASVDSDRRSGVC